jgi:hypothetical protein
MPDSVTRGRTRRFAELPAGQAWNPGMARVAGIIDRIA